jgi:hypothetical protein
MAHDITLDAARQMLLKWDSDHLREIIDAVEKGLRDESDTGIDGAKCLVEAVCKTILTERGQEFGNSDSIGTLIRKTTQALGISDQDAGDNLQQMVRSMTGAVDGLQALRNAFGPLGHGHDANHAKLGDWHRLMAARTAETICALLFEAHCGREKNLLYTRDPFDEEDLGNHKIDRTADIQIDAETFEIVINEAYRYRPSQILYDLDRDGYINERTKAMSLPDEDAEEEP